MITHQNEPSNLDSLKVSPLKKGGNEFSRDNSMQDQLFYLSDVVRRDQDFINTNKPRLGGRSFSSGVFTERNNQNKEWVGKAHIDGFMEGKQIVGEYNFTEQDSEARACKEKLANDIYAFYGAKVPKVEISRQLVTNLRTKDEQEKYRDTYAVHVMSEFIADFKTLDKALSDQDPGSEFQKRMTEFFRKKTLFSKKHNKELPERGLGHILAVAALINDFDVIGKQGENVGFQINTDSEGRKYYEMIKIDPGEAFDDDPEISKHPRKIKIAKQGQGFQPYLPFDILNETTQKEFLLTLHKIVNTSPGTFDGFFRRQGGLSFILVYGRSVEELAELLLKRQKELARDFSKELATITDQDWSNYLNLTKVEQGRHKEEAAFQAQLSFYITPTLASPKSGTNSPVSQNFAHKEDENNLPDQITAFLDGPEKVLLLKGESGSGKTLLLLKLWQQKLKKKREEVFDNLDIAESSRHTDNHPMPIYIALNRFDIKTVRNCLESTLRDKYHFSIDDVKRRNIVLLLDGYDEIYGNHNENLYFSQKLDTWEKVKVIITCRSENLMPDYQRQFMPESINAYKEYEIQPFDQTLIRKYLKRYITETKHLSCKSSSPEECEKLLEDYEKKIQSLPNLNRLITKPLILRIVAESLPELLAHEQREQVNQFIIYESFMRSWFIRQEKRLVQSAGQLNVEEALASFDQFSRELAFNLYIHGKVEASSEDAMLEKCLNNNDPDNSCPLQRLSNQAGGYSYNFIHKSFLEYFVACQIIVYIKRGENQILKPIHIVKSFAVVQFLRESTDTVHPMLREQCIERVIKSKNNLTEPASNAITFLNAIQESFSGMNLSQINVPGAILSNGFFHNTDFTDANLTDVDLTNGKLMDAKFVRTNLKNIRLGIYPDLIGPKDRSINCIVFTSDGKTIATSSSTMNGEVSLWDATTCKIKTTARLHCGSVMSLAFSPDEKYFASSGLDQMVKLSTLSGRYSFVDIKALTGHLACVPKIAFFPSKERKFLASASYDKTIKLWTYPGGELIKTIDSGHDGVINDIAFSPDGKILASVDSMKTLKLWMSNSWIPITSIKGHDESINKVVFSPNGDFLATASSEKVKLWDMKTFGIITTLSGHSNQVTTIAFPPYSGGKSSTLASGSLDQTVKLWDISSGELQETITFNHMVHYVTFTPTGFAADGNVIAVSNDSNVKLCETGTFLTTSFRGHTSAIKAIAFAPDGHFVATASDDLTIKLWNRKTSCLETTIVGEEKAISCMKVSPDERIIATASSNSVKLWDIKTQQFVAKIINKEGCVNNIRFCSDGKTIAIAGYDSLKLVDYQGNVKKTLDGYHDHVQDMLLDKQIVVKTNRSGETCLLNSENGKLIKSFPGSCPCISSHGKFIATITSGLAVTGGALAIIIWSLLTFERVAILPCSPQLDSLEKIAFSADDNTIAAHGYRNNFVQLWDIKGNLLAVLEHQDWVTDIVFAPDGNTLATAAHGVIVYLWEGTSNTKTWLLKRELSNVDTTLRCRGLVLDGALNLSDINQNVLEQRRTKISDDDDDDEQEEEEEKDQQIYYDRNIPTFDYLDFFKKLGYSTIRDGDGSHDLGSKDE